MVTSSTRKGNTFAKIGKLVIPVFVMILIIYEARNIFSEIDLHKVFELMKSISPRYIGIFLATAVVAELCLCGYDILLMNYYSYNLSLPTILRISWISVSFNNIIGLGGLTGASLRTYLFKKEGINMKDLINYNIILVPSTILGLGILSYFGAFDVLHTYGILNIYKWLWLPLLVFCGFIPVYFLLGKISFLNKFLDRFNLFFEGSFDIKFKFAVCSTIEWISRAVLFYAIARSFNSEVSFLAILGVDVMSSVAGLISFIPNGIGSYDIIALMGLELLGFSGNIGLSIILLFRIFYFIIPWLIGGILWFVTMISQIFKKKSI